MRDRVRAGYEKADFAAQQTDDADLHDPYEDMFHAFLEELPDNGHVIDMGCGSGVPYDRLLIDEGYEVTGVDIANANIRAARESVPEARFIREDFTRFEPETTFDGLLCLFALFHIPREEHGETLQQFRSMLKTGSPLLITMGTADVERLQDEFAGARMEWSFYDVDRNRDLVENTGFDILRTAMIPDERDGSDHLWLLAEAT